MAQIALIVLFILFAVLHIAWFVYIWKLDFKWRSTQAMQQECDTNALELDTVRWNMNKIFKGDTALKPLKQLTIAMVAIFPVAYAIAAFVTLMTSRKTFTRLTDSKWEFLQHLPTPFYYNGVAALLLFATMAIVSISFGATPGVNKLLSLMTPYAQSLVNVEKTMRLVKSRAAPKETEYDREVYMKELITKRVAMVQGAESQKMAESMVDTMDAKEWIGYLQFKNDSLASSLCRFIQQDVAKMTSSDVTNFEEALTEFINSSPQPFSLTPFKYNLSEDDQYGYCVSVSEDGNTVAVSAPTKETNANENACVYVFNRTNTSPPWQAKKLSPPDNSSISRFGGSIALSRDGNIIAVGANEAVFVYKKTTAGNNTITWEKMGEPIVPEKPNKSATSSGYTVALSYNGGILAMGATYKSYGNYVYLFTLTGSNYTRKISDTIINEEFGLQLGLSNDGFTLVVGSPVTSNKKTEPSRGAVYVYAYGSDTKTWSSTKKLEPSNANVTNFGKSVSLSSDGNIVAIGADDSAFVYVRTGNEWAVASTLRPSVKGKTSEFGSCVAISPNGNVVAVGDPGKALVYLFIKSVNVTTWYEHKQIQLSDADFFGGSIALSANMVSNPNRVMLVVGAKDTDVGAAYIFEGYNTVWVDTDALAAMKGALLNIFKDTTFPYLSQYISDLTEANILNFISTWYTDPRDGTVPTIRLAKVTAQDATNGTYDMGENAKELWQNVLTPLICQYWKGSWGWNEQLKELSFGDPSPKLKEITRQTKIYFGLILIFIFGIIYMHVPKKTLLPLAVFALIMVFMFAYLLKFIH